jgi:hypothetical protein
MTILDDVQGYINKYVVLPNQEEQSLILASWVVHTWAFKDIALTTPYIYVCSAEKQSGKSTLIEVLSSIARDGLKATDLTGPVLFRAISQLDPTIFIDEADALWSGAKNEGLRGAINGGYKFGGSVLRLDKGVPVQFNTFCPKLIAGIHNGKLPDTILDRSIPVILKRKRPGQDAMPFFQTSVEGEVDKILDGIDEWLEQNVDSLRAFPIRSIDGLSDRQSEIVWPLLAITDIFGKSDDLITAVKHTLAQYNETMVEEDITRVTLQMIADTFDSEMRGALFTKTITEALEINDKALAAVLAVYGVESRTVRVGNRTGKGYKAADMWDAWDAYGIAPASIGRPVS